MVTQWPPGTMTGVEANTACRTFWTHVRKILWCVFAPKVIIMFITSKPHYITTICRSLVSSVNNTTSTRSRLNVREIHTLLAIAKSFRNSVVEDHLLCKTLICRYWSSIAVSTRAGEPEPSSQKILAELEPLLGLWVELKPKKVSSFSSECNMLSY